MLRFERIIWVVLDSVGIGPLPDAADYGDTGRNTFGHIAESRPLKLPTLVELGLGNIATLANLPPVASPAPHSVKAQRIPLEGTQHRPLGNGRHLAAPGLSRLSGRFPAGDRRI